MAYPPAQPQVLKIGYKTWQPIVALCSGALLLAVGLLSLLSGSASLGLFTGPLFIVLGILMFFKPIFSYDFATGGLYTHAVLGYRARTYGPPKGERLWFDGVNLLRILPDGQQKRVSLRAGRPEQVAQLLQVITSAQQ